MHLDALDYSHFADFRRPLEVDEVISLMRFRWQVSFDLQLVTRGKYLYLQMMWGFLEQKSFPLSDNEYRLNLAYVIEVINRIGQEALVREWLLTSPKRPTTGRAISLPLRQGACLEEFLV